MHYGLDTQRNMHFFPFNPPSLNCCCSDWLCRLVPQLYNQQHPVLMLGLAMTFPPQSYLINVTFSSLFLLWVNEFPVLPPPPPAAFCLPIGAAPWPPLITAIHFSSPNSHSGGKWGGERDCWQPHQHRGPVGVSEEWCDSFRPELGDVA